MRPSTMSRWRCKTFAISTETGPVVTPNSPARATMLATPALQISFLLGRQLMFGQEPPIQRRSTTAVRWPACAMCQARYLPPSPLPITTTSYRSGSGIATSCPQAGSPPLTPTTQRLGALGHHALNVIPFRDVAHLCYQLYAIPKPLSENERDTRAVGRIGAFEIPIFDEGDVGRCRPQDVILCADRLRYVDCRWGLGSHRMILPRPGRFRGSAQAIL